MKTDGIGVSPVSPNIFRAKWHVLGLEDIGARHLCLQILHTCIHSGLSETNPKIQLFIMITHLQELHGYKYRSDSQ